MLHFDQDAQEFFDGWHANLERRLRDPDEHPVIVAHLAKYRSLMPSLALVFHAADRATAAAFGPVRLEPAERAASWCDYLEAHARRIYYGVISRADNAVRLLGEKIRAGKLPSSFTMRDVYRPQWAGLTESADVALALDALEDLGWLDVRASTSTGAGGRPTKIYYVNPKIWARVG